MFIPSLSGRLSLPARTVAFEQIEDLKGKSVAVTRGTDPHIFLLRALHTKGLTENNVTAVLLQHPDGYRALATRQVHAWAGLDPHMAKAQIETDAVLFYRNQSFNTYGILNVREVFAKRYPELVRRVLAAYERARIYAVAIRTNSQPSSWTPQVSRLKLPTSSLPNEPTCRRRRSVASIGDLRLDWRGSAQDWRHRHVGRRPARR